MEGRFQRGRDLSRAGIPIGFIHSEDICDVRSGLDLGLNVTQEGRATCSEQHWDEFKLGETFEGRGRSGAIIVIPCQIGSRR